MGRVPNGTPALGVRLGSKVFAELGQVATGGIVMVDVRHELVCGYVVDKPSDATVRDIAVVAIGSELAIGT